MNKLITLTLIILFSFRTFAAETMTETDYEAICKYDKYCKRLKTVFGSFKTVDPALTAALENFGPEIVAAAKSANVDPRAIAGAILTENSLNVGLTDAFQTMLVENGVTKDGKAFGRSFTYGLGQINCETAFAVESKAATIYNRTARSHDEVCKAILESKESMQYVGVIIRDAIDIYKEQGIDISKDIGIQTTLYNLGKVKEKALAAKASGQAPRLNYYGYFVQKHFDEIDSILEKSLKAGPAKVAAAKTEAIDLIDGLEDAVDLQSMLPQCPGHAASIRQEGFQAEIKTKKSATGPSKILSRAVDCKMDSWLLIEDSKEASGWVKESDYQKNLTKYGVIDKRDCKVSDVACATELKKQFTLIANNQKLGAVDISIINFKKPPTYNPDPEFYRSGGRAESTAKSSTNYNSLCTVYGETDQISSYNYSDTLLTSEQIQTLKDKLNAKLSSKTADSGKISHLGSMYDLYFCKDTCHGDFKETSNYIEQLDKPIPTNSLTTYPVISISKQTVKTYANEDDVAEVGKCVANLKGKQDVETALSVNRLTGIFQTTSQLAYSLIDTDHDGGFLNFESLCNQASHDKLSADKAQKLADAAKAMTDSYVELQKKFVEVTKNCEMGFEDTMAMVQKILKSNCVDKVYIADPVIFEIVSKFKPDRVAFLPTKKNDRVSVSFKETCDGYYRLLSKVPDSKSAAAKPTKAKVSK